MSDITVLAAAEQTPAIPTARPRSRRLKLVLASAVVLAGPLAFAATAWAQGCSAG